MNYDNPMKFKAYIKKIAIESGVSSQLILQSYVMEKLVERIAVSEYKYNFILKGGFLISSIVGINTRTTMDLDTTVKGLDLSHNVISEIFNEICNIDLNDNIKFHLYRISNIREGDEYPGIRVSLIAKIMTLNVQIKVDVTTGDKITPKEIEYKYKLIFSDKTISILAYNLETILAEKLETVLSRDIVNTRPRDFYDLYILYFQRGFEINYSILKKALEETSSKRGSKHLFLEYKSIINRIESDQSMNKFWLDYQKDFNYVKEITFNQTCDVILKILDVTLI